MERLANFDLSQFTKDDLMYLFEEYPTLFDMSEAELIKLANSLYEEARLLSARAGTRQNEAHAVAQYVQAKYRNTK